MFTINLLRQLPRLAQRLEGTTSVNPSLITFPHPPHTQKRSLIVSNNRFNRYPGRNNACLIFLTLGITAVAHAYFTNRKPEENTDLYHSDDDSRRKYLIQKLKISEVMVKSDTPIEDELKKWYLRTYPKADNSTIDPRQNVFNQIWSPSESNGIKLLDDFKIEYEESIRSAIKKGGNPELILTFMKHTFFENSSYTEEQKQKLACDFFLDIWKQCLEGEAGYFSLLAAILDEGSINGIVLIVYPMNNPSSRLEILRRFSDLGVARAKDALLRFYRDGVSGNLSIKDRLEGLRFLALGGHVASQTEYGKILHKGKFDTWEIPSEKCKRDFQELIDNEVGINPYVTDYYLMNGGFNFAGDLSPEGLIDILKSRAERGDKSAFHALFNMLTKNRNSFIFHHHTEITPYLTNHLWEQIYELRKLDPETWNHMMQHFYWSGDPYERLVVPFSEKERFQYILDNALTMEERAVDLLTDTLTDEDDFEGLITMQERFQRLYDLALQGGLIAKKKVLKIILNHEEAHSKYEIDPLKAFAILSTFVLNGCEESELILANTLFPREDVASDSILRLQYGNWDPMQCDELVRKIVLISKNKAVVDRFLNAYFVSSEKIAQLKYLNRLSV